MISVYVQPKGIFKILYLINKILIKNKPWLQYNMTWEKYCEYAEVIELEKKEESAFKKNGKWYKATKGIIFIP